MNSDDKPHLPEPEKGEITQLLLKWKSGDPEARGRLAERVYNELRILARIRLRRMGRHNSMLTGDLVQEAFKRLIDSTKITAENRKQFFALASKAMRNILLDVAKSKIAQRREGMNAQVPLDEAPDVPLERSRELIALDDALLDLATFDPRLSEVVDLKYFGGMSIEEIAECLKVSTATVKRDWATARSWLRGQLQSSH